ncbi:NEK/NEK6 protein kinase [Sphaeroforma arctica JP610]|uniref:non-specific serine/threonine protein kinase n=1 Tax=Sphaeroforma arctica JP610 TaxID=667725 RepID=A0A0L0FTH9_9EUKA|nr:NEK/NEK6 protein kinase [Sphaeroforma arctica JP610]KNC80004.1 NEK/NEK6 protein kinase [Sphaeroforma arctica JP610]|eukprot:XP_014153906.1 NEK/NEK6 protein kinase [Sphaeroforma arctica JP610]
MSGQKRGTSDRQPLPTRQSPLSLKLNAVTYTSGKANTRLSTQDEVYSHAQYNAEEALSVQNAQNATLDRNKDSAPSQININADMAQQAPGENNGVEINMINTRAQRVADMYDSRHGTTGTISRQISTRTGKDVATSRSISLRESTSETINRTESCTALGGQHIVPGPYARAQPKSDAHSSANLNINLNLERMRPFGHSTDSLSGSRIRRNVSHPHSLNSVSVSEGIAAGPLATLAEFPVQKEGEEEDPRYTDWHKPRSNSGACHANGHVYGSVDNINMVSRRSEASTGGDSEDGIRFGTHTSSGTGQLTWSEDFMFNLSASFLNSPLELALMDPALEDDVTVTGIQDSMLSTTPDLDMHSPFSQLNTQGAIPQQTPEETPIGSLPGFGSPEWVQRKAGDADFIGQTGFDNAEAPGPPEVTAAEPGESEEVQGLQTQLSALQMGGVYESVDNFHVDARLGSGQFSEVFQATNTITGKLVALKKISMKDVDDISTRQDVIKEIFLLRDLSHEHIIRYYGTFMVDMSLYIVLEFAGAGDLRRMINHFKTTQRTIPELVLWKYFLQICKGIEYMHSKKIIHRDVKPANVFITKTGNVKLGDLGLGRVMKDDFLASSMVGTPYYMAPERIKGADYDLSSDIWSLGCLLYEMAALKSPFYAEKMSLVLLCERIKTCEYPPLSQSYTSHLRTVAIECMQADNAKRPLATTVRESAQKMYDVHLQLDSHRERLNMSTGTSSHTARSVPARSHSCMEVRSGTIHGYGNGGGNGSVRGSMAGAEGNGGLPGIRPASVFATHVERNGHAYAKAQANAQAQANIHAHAHTQARGYTRTRTMTDGEVALATSATIYEESGSKAMHRVRRNSSTSNYSPSNKKTNSPYAVSINGVHHGVSYKYKRSSSLTWNDPLGTADLQSGLAGGRLGAKTGGHERPRAHTPHQYTQAPMHPHRHPHTHTHNHTPSQTYPRSSSMSYVPSVLAQYPAPSTGLTGGLGIYGPPPGSRFHSRTPVAIATEYPALTSQPQPHVSGGIGHRRGNRTLYRVSSAPGIPNLKQTNSTHNSPRNPSNVPDATGHLKSYTSAMNSCSPLSNATSAASAHTPTPAPNHVDHPSTPAAAAISTASRAQNHASTGMDIDASVVTGTGLNAHGGLSSGLATTKATATKSSFQKVKSSGCVARRKSASAVARNSSGRSGTPNKAKRKMGDMGVMRTISTPTGVDDNPHVRAQTPAQSGGEAQLGRDKKHRVDDKINNTSGANLGASAESASYFATDGSSMGLRTSSSVSEWSLLLGMESPGAESSGSGNAARNQDLLFNGAGILDQGLLFDNGGLEMGLDLNLGIDMALDDLDLGLIMKLDRGNVPELPPTGELNAGMAQDMLDGLKATDSATDPVTLKQSCDVELGSSPRTLAAKPTPHTKSPLVQGYSSIHTQSMPALEPTNTSTPSALFLPTLGLALSSELVYEPATDSALSFLSDRDRLDLGVNLDMGDQLYIDSEDPGTLRDSTPYHVAQPSRANTPTPRTASPWPIDMSAHRRSSVSGGMAYGVVKGNVRTRMGSVGSALARTHESTPAHAGGMRVTRATRQGLQQNADSVCGYTYQSLGTSAYGVLTSDTTGSGAKTNKGTGADVNANQLTALTQASTDSAVTIAVDNESKNVEPTDQSGVEESSSINSLSGVDNPTTFRGQRTGRTMSSSTITNMTAEMALNDVSLEWQPQLNQQRSPLYPLGMQLPSDSAGSTQYENVDLGDGGGASEVDFNREDGFGRGVTSFKEQFQQVQRNLDGEGDLVTDFHLLDDSDGVNYVTDSALWDDMA